MTTTTTPKPTETVMEKYARETRNAVRTIMIIMLIGLVVGLIGSISIGVAISHINQPASNCLTTGGTNPAC